MLIPSHNKNINIKHNNHFIELKNTKLQQSPTPLLQQLKRLTYTTYLSLPTT